MQVVYGILSALLGYAFGCFNMAYILGKRKGIDIRTQGSHNAGTSNAMILLGWPSAILVGFCDIGKGFLACFLAQLLFEFPLFGGIAMVFCVLGHMYPFYIQFSGGKSFACYLGALLAFDWRLFLAMCLVVALMVLITDYIVLGTFSVITLAPIWLWLTKGFPLGICVIVASLLVLQKHRVNIKRLIHHEEIGLRVVSRKKKEAKK